MAMKKEIVTIIIASFNACKYIHETLESCISQTYQNIQIIIADDCSQDNSVEIIKKWCVDKKLTHPLIECILVENEQNNGITRNFNSALRYARGTWIKCLGSDDLLLPDAIDNFIKRLSTHDNYRDVGAVFTLFETFGVKITNPQRFPMGWTKRVAEMSPSWYKRQLTSIHFNNVAPGAFINRRFLDEFDESYRLLEDLPLWIKLVNRDIPTLFFPYVSVKYRIHDSQVTSSASPIKKILQDDLKLVNENRFINKYYLGYFHNKYNLYCDIQYNHISRYMKILNPINVFIKVCDKLF